VENGAKKVREKCGKRFEEECGKYGGDGAERGAGFGCGKW